MSDLFNNDLFSDFKAICSDGVEFKLHRAFLYSNEYFKAMLTSNMIESNEAKFPENSDVLEEVFRFIYSRKLRKNSLDVKELFLAAQKYLVDDLAYQCMLKIQQDLNIKNSIETVIFAYIYDFVNLDSVIEFVGRNFKEVKNSSGWKLINKEKYSDLRDMLIDAYIKHVNMPSMEISSQSFFFGAPRVYNIKK